MGQEQADEEAKLLRLPCGEQYLNHLGTVHAGALLALAEAKFRKPANGAVTSAVSVGTEALSELDADLAGKGRALVAVRVELHDESGAHVLTATVEWFIQRL